MKNRITKEEELEMLKMLEELKEGDFISYKYLVGVIQGISIYTGNKKLNKN